MLNQPGSQGARGELSLAKDTTSLLPTSELDAILTDQIIVAWAGEGGEEPRLGWWRTDLISEFGGEDVFQRLLPKTWKWAVLQATLEAARRLDFAMRRQDHEPDRLLSLYHLGFAIDEQLRDRFQELKRAGEAPVAALPGLGLGVDQDFNSDRFLDWVSGHGKVDVSIAPAGRRILGPLPAAPADRVRKLVASLAPLAESYPMPHYRMVE